jgi:chromosome segregation ATPase
MTNSQPERSLDRIEAILATVATQQASTQQQLDNLTRQQVNTQQQLDNLTRQQVNTQQQLDNLTLRQVNTQQQLDDLISTANSVFARDAILNDVLLELHENSERHQRNFEEHQITTNAALQSLEAILLQLQGRMH